MRYAIVYATLGSLLMIPAAWAQEAPAHEWHAPGAFSQLSPGEQTIVRAMVASEIRDDGRVPLSSNRIAELKLSGEGFGQIFHEMRAAGDTRARNLGQAISEFRHASNGHSREAFRHFDHDEDGRFDHDWAHRGRDRDDRFAHHWELHDHDDFGRGSRTGEHFRTHAGNDAASHSMVHAGRAGSRSDGYTTAIGHSSFSGHGMVTASNGGSTAPTGGSRSGTTSGSHHASSVTGLGHASGGAHGMFTAKAAGQ